MDAVVEKPRHANQTPLSLTRAKQAAYLKALSETGSHAKACQFADIGDTRPFYWCSNSQEFSKRREAAQAQGDKVLLAQYEEHLDTAVLSVKTIEDFAKVQNSQFFRMKRLDPRYRDNAVVEVNVKGPAAVQINLGASMQRPQAEPQAEPELRSKVGRKST